MNCNCIEKVNKELEARNLKLDCVAIIFGDNIRAAIELDTAWVDKDKAPRGKKNRPTAMIASHCPFCGKPTKPIPSED